MSRDVYSATLKLYGEEHPDSLLEASNYAPCLVRLKHFKEAKSLLCKTMPVARRVLGESNETTLRMKRTFAEALYQDPTATLDDIREAVTTLEVADRIARRVFGAAPHPATVNIAANLRHARATLRAREAGRSVVFTTKRLE